MFLTERRESHSSARRHALFCPALSHCCFSFFLFLLFYPSSSMSPFVSTCASMFLPSPGFVAAFLFDLHPIAPWRLCGAALFSFFFLLFSLPLAAHAFRFSFVSRRTIVSRAEARLWVHRKCLRMPAIVDPCPAPFDRQYELPVFRKFVVGPVLVSCTRRWNFIEERTSQTKIKQSVAVLITDFVIELRSGSSVLLRNMENVRNSPVVLMR